MYIVFIGEKFIFLCFNLYILICKELNILYNSVCVRDMYLFYFI